MAKKKAAGRDAGSSRPKQLRKRLRKAESQLLDATAERDRAQARVEALAIIADEVRARLAEGEKAARSSRSKAADEAKSAPPGAANRARMRGRTVS